MITAIFEAYISANKNNLAEKMIDHVKEWSHIGQVRASDQLNMVEVPVYLKGNASERLKCKINNAAFGSGWKLRQLA